MLLNSLCTTCYFGRGWYRLGYRICPRTTLLAWKSHGAATAFLYCYYILYQIFWQADVRLISRLDTEVCPCVTRFFGFIWATAGHRRFVAVEYVAVESVAVESVSTQYVYVSLWKSKSIFNRPLKCNYWKSVSRKSVSRESTQFPADRVKM